MNNPTAILKAINRHVRRNNVFSGGRSFGVDYTTWSICYPQMSSVFNKAAQQITGRPGRFLPRFN
jgi:hypothetical protein